MVPVVMVVRGGALVPAVPVVGGGALVDGGQNLSVQSATPVSVQEQVLQPSVAVKLSPGEYCLPP